MGCYKVEVYRPSSLIQIEISKVGHNNGYDFPHCDDNFTSFKTMLKFEDMEGRLFENHDIRGIPKIKTDCSPVNFSFLLGIYIKGL